MIYCKRQINDWLNWVVAKIQNIQTGVRMTIEKNAMACNRFLMLVRDFIARIKPYHTAIRYDVRPDDVRDITKISQKVYGTRNEYLAVMAAAGLSTVDQPVKIQTLILPTFEQLLALKKKAGFENNHTKRRFGDYR